uniref:Uncharacterized protein n=1 Tax=viral metagenome TaxID=1070528 RepID=A0A6C0AEZ0_9ZZZZ
MEIDLNLLEKPKYKYLKDSDFYKNLDLNCKEKIFILYICPIDEKNIDTFGKTIDFWCLNKIPSCFFQLISKKIKRDVKSIEYFLNSNIDSVRDTTYSIINKDIFYFIKKIINLNFFHILEIIFEKFKVQKGLFQSLIIFFIKKDNVEAINFLINKEKINYPEIYENRLNILLEISIKEGKFKCLKYFHEKGVSLRYKFNFIHKAIEKFENPEYQKCLNYYVENLEYETEFEKKYLDTIVEKLSLIKVE